MAPNLRRVSFAVALPLDVVALVGEDAEAENGLLLFDMSDFEVLLFGTTFSSSLIFWLFCCSDARSGKLKGDDDSSAPEEADWWLMTASLPLVRLTLIQSHYTARAQGTESVPVCIDQEYKESKLDVGPYERMKVVHATSLNTEKTKSFRGS